MSKRYNPLSNGSIAQAKKMYEDLGLCYEHGQSWDRCGCISPEQAEEWKALEIVVDLVPPEPIPLVRDPDRLGEAVALAYMEHPEPIFGSAEWWEEVEEIDPGTA